MASFLHRPPDLCLGHRHRHHAGGPGRHQQAGAGALPGHRTDAGLDQHQLPRRLGEGHRGLGDADHRAEPEGHRRPAVDRIDEQRRRQRQHHAHLRGRHQPGHRAGAGAEQGAIRHQPAAAGGAGAGRAREQIGRRLPDGDDAHQRRPGGQLGRPRRLPELARWSTSSAASRASATSTCSAPATRCASGWIL